jgi:hypothetical protein
MYNLKSIAMIALLGNSPAANSFMPISISQTATRGVVVGNPIPLSSPSFGALHVSTTSNFVNPEENATMMEVRSMAEEAAPQMPKPQSQKKQVAAPKKTAGPHGKQGPLSPVVLAAKAVMGNDESRFNKLRAKVISLHSDVIESFIVGTSETPVGRAISKQLFELTDRDRNGSIEIMELAQAFQTLGFDWLKEKQVEGIFQRADKDENGHIELEEWLAEAPKTLRTNLIKLAKKNGGELGLLA